MKKIGILFGQEDTFPWAVIEKINSQRIDGIQAEPVRIDRLGQGEPSGYAVIIDRISQDVPFYRAYLKNAALGGTAVINNPFWWSADEKFFNNCLALKLGVAETVPEAAPVPAAFVAVTEQVYVVPLARPVTAIGEAVPLAVPPGAQFTV